MRRQAELLGRCQEVRRGRHTVSKCWNRGGSSPDDGGRGRQSGFDRYRDETEEKAALSGVTAKGIHELLLERHAGDEPPAPGYNAFTSYLRGRGVAPDARPRFETAPGERLQFDWKEDVTMHDRSGRGYRFDVYASTFGWSRMHYSVRSPTRTRDDLLACMADSIRWLGGVPRQWLADNMSAVATLGGDGRRSRDRRVAAFAREAGFELALCRPGTPQTKGNDESMNRFLSHLRAYEGDFEGWEGLDRAIARVRARSNEEPNRTTGLPPELLFRREKEALGPMPRESVLSALVGDVSGGARHHARQVRRARVLGAEEVHGAPREAAARAGRAPQGLRRRGARGYARHRRPGRADSLPRGRLRRGDGGQALGRRRRRHGGAGQAQSRAAGRARRGRGVVTGPGGVSIDLSTPRGVRSRHAGAGPARGAACGRLASAGQPSRYGSPSRITA